MSISIELLQPLEQSQAINKHPLIVSVNTPIVEVITNMNQQQVSYVLITEEQRLVGIFTERDVVRITAAQMQLKDRLIAQVMSKKMITITLSPEHNIFSVLTILRKHKIRHLPVVDDFGKIIGIVTQSSIRAVLQPIDFLKIKPVISVMTANVIYEKTTVSLLHITQKMAKHHKSCVVITETRNQTDIIPVGIITERDIVNLQTKGTDLFAISAAEVMSQPLLPIKTVDSLFSAHQLMQNYHIRRLVVVDESGKLAGLITQSTILNTLDPMELYTTLQVLQQEKEAAEAANIAKNQFLSQMSHELRTPLNAILGFTQIMNRNGTLTTEQHNNLKIIQGSGEHLLKLINNILEITKIEAGKISFEESSFDLYYLLDCLLEIFQLKATTKNLKLVFELSPNLPQYVQTDQGKLRQVLINLLDNAIKFTEKGSVILEVSLTNNCQKLLFKITDTGCGISAELLKSLFVPFIQDMSDFGAVQGMGLGLAISKKYVELMGGATTITSILDQGTTLKFEILFKDLQTTIIQTITPHKRVVGLEPDQKEYRLLVAEADWISRQLLIKLLTSVGFKVCAAINGEEAVSLWESFEPNLILMNMQMPILNGYEATQQIKTHLKGQATVIIALTNENRSLSLSAGCDDFLPKLFQEAIMFEKIAEHLGISYLYEELPTLTKSRTSEQLTLDALTVMPKEWLEGLYFAILSCQNEEVLQLIQKIPEPHQSLKQNLINLVEAFQLDLIIDLTEGFINESR
jgi:signal transduction histidine kinase/DNA-binding NarL/FixJ family response regulator